MKKNLKKKLSFTKLQQHLEDIINEVNLIKQILQRELPPEHFSFKDIVRSFFGATFIGVTFVFNKNLVELVPMLNSTRITLVILSTILLLSFEIYFIGYQRVSDKTERKFFQFWFKRIITFYLVAIVVSLYLSFLYNVTGLVGSIENIIRLVVAMSMPCSVGASIADLLKETG